MSAGGKPLAHLARALVGALALGLLPCPAVAKSDKGKDKLEATLTAPAEGALYTAPATIALSARALAKQRNHPIVKVEFFQGATPIGTVSGPQPDNLYRLSWTSVGAGTYRLTAEATNDKGDTDTSAAVTVTVNAAAAQLYFIHADHLNTPRLVSDATGTTVWRWDQDEPFGLNAPDENPSGLGAFDLPLRLPGQYFDKETNLAYNYFRDYDASIGRYIQSDPIDLQGGLNTFAYVSSNPLSLTDPLGLAYFAKRALRGMPWLGPASCNPIDDFFNTEISHEQLFFEDGKSPANIGFFSDGTLKEEPNPTDYRCKSGQYDDCIMRKAAANTPPPPNYCIIGRNCQTWTDRVKKEYGRLAKDPQVQRECGACK